MFESEPRISKVVETGCICVLCTNGEIMAHVMEQYSGLIGATTAPEISIKLVCKSCKCEHPSLPEKPDLPKEILDKAIEEDRVRRDAEWQEKAGLPDQQEVKVRKIRLGPGEYLGVDGKVYK